jgi:hypothetical protein
MSPPKNGQTKVVKECLETYLRCFSSKKPHQWEKWFPLAKWWYNTSYHRDTKITPFKSFDGQKLL